MVAWQTDRGALSAKGDSWTKRSGIPTACMAVNSPVAVRRT